MLAQFHKLQRHHYRAHTPAFSAAGAVAAAAANPTPHAAPNTPRRGRFPLCSASLQGHPSNNCSVTAATAAATTTARATAAVAAGGDAAAAAAAERAAERGSSHAVRGRMASTACGGFKARLQLQAPQLCSSNTSFSASHSCTIASCLPIQRGKEPHPLASRRLT